MKTSLEQNCPICSRSCFCYARISSFPLLHLRAPGFTSKTKRSWRGSESGAAAEHLHTVLKYVEQLGIQPTLVCALAFWQSWETKVSALWKMIKTLHCSHCFCFLILMGVYFPAYLSDKLPLSIRPTHITAAAAIWHTDGFLDYMQVFP